MMIRTEWQLQGRSGPLPSFLHPPDHKHKHQVLLITLMVHFSFLIQCCLDYRVHRNVVDIPKKSFFWCSMSLLPMDTSLRSSCSGAIRTSSAYSSPTSASSAGSWDSWHSDNQAIRHELMRHTNMQSAQTHSPFIPGWLIGCSLKMDVRLMVVDLCSFKYFVSFNMSHNCIT